MNKQQHKFCLDIDEVLYFFSSKDVVALVAMFKVVVKISVRNNIFIFSSYFFITVRNDFLFNSDSDAKVKWSKIITCV